jgi:hypothetical protein
MRNNLVLIPAGFASFGTKQFMAWGMILISTGKRGPGSPSNSVSISAETEVIAIVFP